MRYTHFKYLKYVYVGDLPSGININSVTSLEH